jgi:hypothetical protein
VTHNYGWLPSMLQLWLVASMATLTTAGHKVSWHQICGSAGKVCQGVSDELDSGTPSYTRWCRSALRVMYSMSTIHHTMVGVGTPRSIDDWVMGLKLVSNQIMRVQCKRSVRSDRSRGFLWLVRSYMYAEMRADDIKRVAVSGANGCIASSGVLRRYPRC